MKPGIHRGFILILLCGGLTAVNITGSIAGNIPMSLVVIVLSMLLLRLVKINNR